MLDKPQDREPLGTCEWPWHKVPHEYGEDCFRWKPLEEVGNAKP